MDNVVHFPAQKRPAIQRSSVCEGATLFMHMKKATLIVHLINPRGPRIAAVGKTNKV